MTDNASFNDKTWELMIDELCDAEQLKVNRDNLQATNEWFVEAQLIPNKVSSRRVYIKGKLQE